MDEQHDSVESLAIFDDMEKIVRESLLGDSDISIVLIQNHTQTSHRRYARDWCIERLLFVHLCVFRSYMTCVTIGQHEMKSHTETRRFLIHAICVGLGDVMSSDYFSYKFSIGMVPQLITSLNLSSDDILCLLDMNDDKRVLSQTCHDVVQMHLALSVNL